MKKITYALGLVAVLLAGGCGDNSAQHSALPRGIGDVDVVVRLVHGTLANQDVRRTLAVQDAVYWRELIETGQESATEVEFVDGTRLTVGADAKVNLDEFVYGGPPGTDRMVMTVTKGMSRFVTGNMDKAAYEIRAPGAIIGVRGTEFTLVVDPEAETTLCVVHRGEVEMRRPDGGESVVVQPGKASTASSKAQGWITPAAPPSSDVIRTTETLQSVVHAAKEEQRTARADAQRREQVTDTDRGTSTLSMRRLFGRQRLQDIAHQLRTFDNTQHDQGGSETAAKAAAASVGVQPAKPASGKSTAAAQPGGTRSGIVKAATGGSEPTVTKVSVSQLVPEPEPADTTSSAKSESATKVEDAAAGTKSGSDESTHKASSDEKSSTTTQTSTVSTTAGTGDAADVVSGGSTTTCSATGSCKTPRQDLDASPVVSKSSIRGG
jgi:Uncharacterized protein conserved in bacteria